MYLCNLCDVMHFNIHSHSFPVHVFRIICAYIMSVPGY